MDENKRDELQSEEELVQADEIQADEESVPAEETIEETTTDELAQELEEIRDMFQQELDKAAEEAENSHQTFIQELDEFEETQEDAVEFTGRLCEICEANPCAEEYGEDYPYCEE